MQSLTPELAEVCGIHAGDGYLRYGRRCEIDISGNIEEKGYYDNHVIPLFKKVFDVEINGKFFPSRNTYGFRLNNKPTIRKLMGLGFPSGAKSLCVKAPECIKSAENPIIIWRFLRGYFDTDGCLTFDRKLQNSNIFKKTKHFYPKLLFTTVSANLSEDLKFMFEKFRFRSCFYTYEPKKQTENTKHRMQITGKAQLSKWMDLIGMRNPIKYSRYLIWKKHGHCPPYTTFEERVNVLKGQISISDIGPIA